MSRYPQGQPVYLPFAVTDNTVTPPVPVDGGTLVLTVQKPDGTPVTYTPTHDGAVGSGKYHQIVPATDLTQIGQHKWKLVISGAGAGVTAGIFDVVDPFEVAVLSLGDAKDMLNIPQTNTTFDAELQRKIASIESSLERVFGGPIISRQIVERAELTSGYTTLMLRKRPVVSVQSMVSTASGSPIDITDIEIDPNSNIVRRKLGLPFYGPYFTWMPIFTVIYTAGLGTAVQPAISEGAAVILKHLWDTQRGVGAVPAGGDEMTTIPGMGFMVPNLAADLLAPWTLEAYV